MVIFRLGSFEYVLGLVCTMKHVVLCECVVYTVAVCVVDWRGRCVCVWGGGVLLPESGGCQACISVL